MNAKQLFGKVLTSMVTVLVSVVLVLTIINLEEVDVPVPNSGVSDNDVWWFVYYGEENTYPCGLSFFEALAQTAYGYDDYEYLVETNPTDSWEDDGEKYLSYKLYLGKDVDWEPGKVLVINFYPWSTGLYDSHDVFYFRWKTIKELWLVTIAPSCIGNDSLISTEMFIQTVP